MYKIAVIGDRDSVMGFMALGLDVFYAEDAEEARKILHRLTGEQYAIIYVTEQLSVEMQAEIERYKKSAMPAIILIPGRTGAMGIAQNKLQTLIERAVGADIA